MQRLFICAISTIAWSLSAAQFNGTYGPDVTTAPPNTLGATGWGTGTGSFPAGVPWQWSGTFSWTVAAGASGVTGPAAPVGSGTRGTTTINFSNMATGMLPADTWVHLGDIDEGNWETIELQALDANGAIINPNLATGRWLKLPQHYWPQTGGGYARPIASFPTQSAAFLGQSYLFTGYDAGNSLRTLALRTSVPIRTLIVRKNQVNNGFGLVAPREDPFQGREELDRGCCEGRNYVENPTFKFGNTGFDSKFVFNGIASGPGSRLNPGEYGIFTGASVVSRLTPPPLPLVVDEVTGLMGSGTFLVGRVTNNPTVIWRQKIDVPQGELVSCVRLKPFYHAHPATPFVNVSVKFTDSNGTHTHGPASYWPLPLPGAGGWHDFTATFHHGGAGAVVMEIIVDSPGANNPHFPIYLAIDNVALKPKTMVPNAAKFAITPSIANLNLSTGQYNVVLTNWPNPSGLGYYWSIKDLTSSTLPEVQNPPRWWFAVHPTSGFNFPDFDGTTMTVANFSTSSMSPSVPPGKFLTNRRYLITYGLWGKCEKWQTARWEVGYFGPSKKDGGPEIRRLPVDANAKPPKGFNPGAIFEKLRPNRPPSGKPGLAGGGRGG